MKERLEDFFFIGLSVAFTLSGFWALWYTETERQSLRLENEELRHHLSLLCQHVDSLPKPYRAVFDVCLQKNQ